MASVELGNVKLGYILVSTVIKGSGSLGYKRLNKFQIACDRVEVRLG